MRRKWLIVAILGVTFGAGVPVGSFAQNSSEAAKEARQMEVARQLRQGNKGGSEIATVAPYMALMAVFLGIGVYAFVSGRSSKIKGS